MSRIEETIYHYECDLCNQEIHEKTPFKITTYKDKYLCEECIKKICTKIGTDNIEYYIEEE